MMGRIALTFKRLKRKKEKALIVYITAGDPSLKATEDLVVAFERAGVDLVEIGVPFSDPLADGPVIQAASQRALKKGVNVEKILTLVRRVRKRSKIPVLLMTYLNPIFHYGLRRFSAAAEQAGVDGLIVPDLPPEEGRELSILAKKHHLDLVYLLAPTSTAQRRKKIARASRGFVYYVSLTGVTGMRKALPDDMRQNIRLAKKVSSLPVCAGFGISNPEQAAEVAKVSDGVIVGSALVRLLSLHAGLSPSTFAEKFVKPFARALGKVR